MSFNQQLITFTVIVFATAFMRFVPFILFPDNKPTPKFIHYLGSVLPAAVFGLLMIYALKSVNVLEGTHGIPELIGIIVTATVHLWKKQMLLSISAGTICYMLLIQLIF